MAMIVDEKGNLSFTPDDLPAEVELPNEKLVEIPNPDNIPGLTVENVDGIQTETIPEKEYKKVETPMLAVYGEMTKEDFLMVFYNREAPRAADADEESLARMLKEQRMIIEICRIRERVIKDEFDVRETRKSKAERAKRKQLDLEYKPKTKLQKSAEDEIAGIAATQISERDRNIDKLMKALGCDKDEATLLYDKKGKK